MLPRIAIYIREMQKPTKQKNPNILVLFGKYLKVTGMQCYLMKHSASLRGHPVWELLILSYVNSEESDMFIVFTTCPWKGKEVIWIRQYHPLNRMGKGYSSLFRMSTTRSFGLLDLVFLVGVLKWPVTVSSHKSIRSSAEIRGETSDFRSFNGMDSLDWKKCTHNTNIENITERQIYSQYKTASGSWYQSL